MQHVLAAAHGFGPAGIVFEIGREERQPVTRLRAARLQHGAHVAFALQAANGRAHGMSGS